MGGSGSGVPLPCEHEAMITHCRPCWAARKKRLSKERGYRKTVQRRSPERQYEKDQRRRARHAGVEREWGVTLNWAMERFAGRCQWCGRTVAKGAGWPLGATLDHRIPMARGGGHTKANVVLACFGCNSLKQDRVCGQCGGPITSMRQRRCSACRVVGVSGGP